LLSTTTSVTSSYVLSPPSTRVKDNHIRKKLRIIKQIQLITFCGRPKTTSETIATIKDIQQIKIVSNYIFSFPFHLNFKKSHSYSLYTSIGWQLFSDSCAIVPLFEIIHPMQNLRQTMIFKIAKIIFPSKNFLFINQNSRKMQRNLYALGY